MFEVLVAAIRQCRLVYFRNRSEHPNSWSMWSQGKVFDLAERKLQEHKGNTTLMDQLEQSGFITRKGEQVYVRILQ